MYGNILLLSLCQAMLMTGTGVVLSSSAIVGTQLATQPALATLPLSLQYLTTMLVMFQVSRAMQRWGRRSVFIVGALVGATGMGLAAFGVMSGSFLLFAGAGILIGIHNAVGQFYRFAAADAADADRKSRAISLTLTGGVLAAFIGPNLAGATKNLLWPPFSAAFLVLCAIMVIAAVLASRLRLSSPPSTQATEGRRLAMIMRQPVFIVAVLTSMIGYATMNLLMISAPLAMQGQHAEFSDVTVVIQWHLVAMFAPSFVTGDLIRRFGVLQIIFIGALLMLICVGVHLCGARVVYYTVGLVFLGVGWNFMYIGGTTLLTESYRPEEKGKVQGINDTLVFTTVTLSSLVSGALLDVLGWQALNITIVPFMLIILLAVIWLMSIKRQTAMLRLVGE